MIALFLIIIEKNGLNMKLYKFTASTKKNSEMFMISPVLTSFFFFDTIEISHRIMIQPQNSCVRYKIVCRLRF